MKMKLGERKKKRKSEWFVCGTPIKVEKKKEKKTQIQQNQFTFK